MLLASVESRQELDAILQVSKAGTHTAVIMQVIDVVSYQRLDSREARSHVDTFIVLEHPTKSVSCWLATSSSLQLSVAVEWLL